MKVEPIVAALGAAAAVLLVGVGVLVVRRGVSSLEHPSVKSGDTVVVLGDSLGVGLQGPLTTDLSALGVGVMGAPHVGWNAKQTADLFASRPDLAGAVVVVSLGSNDAGLFDPSTEASAVQSIVDTAFARGASRVLWVIPPNFQSPNPPSPATKQKQATFASLWSDPRVEAIDTDPSLLSSDGIHPGPPGYRTIAQTITAAIT